LGGYGNHFVGRWSHGNGAGGQLANSIDIADGKSIAATGYVGQLNGKPIILADSVGNLSRIQRTESTKAIPVSNPAPIK